MSPSRPTVRRTLASSRSIPAFDSTSRLKASARSRPIPSSGSATRAVKSPPAAASRPARRATSAGSAASAAAAGGVGRRRPPARPVLTSTAATVHPDPSGPRADDIPGDLTPQWGLHLVDVNLVMGDVVADVTAQAKAYGG